MILGTAESGKAEKGEFSIMLCLYTINFPVPIFFRSNKPRPRVSGMPWHADLLLCLFPASSHLSAHKFRLDGGQTLINSLDQTGKQLSEKWWRKKNFPLVHKQGIISIIYIRKIRPKKKSNSVPTLQLSSRLYHNPNVIGKK